MFNHLNLQFSLIALSLATTLACSAATATPSERWKELAAEFKKYDNVQFHVDIQTPRMGDNPFFGPTAGKTHATVWLEPAKKRLVVQTADRRFVFPEGTNHDRYNPPTPIPEPILGLGSGLYHVLTTGFQGCTAEKTDGAPTGMIAGSTRNEWNLVKCSPFPKGWGDSMLVEIGKADDSTPFIQSIVLYVAGEEVRVIFSGLLYNKPLGEHYDGAEFRSVPIPTLDPYDLKVY